MWQARARKCPALARKRGAHLATVLAARTRRTAPSPATLPQARARSEFLNLACGTRTSKASALLEAIKRGTPPHPQIPPPHLCLSGPLLSASAVP